MAFILQPAKSTRYMSFGFMPTGSIRHDLRGRLFGVPNLLKRLQARDIMSALDLRSQDRALDFGCGSGYLTVEMAKRAAHATGIDVNPYVSTIRVPGNLKGRLEFTQTTGTRLPFPDAHFNVVLASEVLPMIPDPAPFLNEIRRVIKPGGRLVIVNGIGVPPIEEAYAANSQRLAALRERHPGNVPATYQDYCAVFQKVAGTGRGNFLTEAEILGALERSGFTVSGKSHSPRRAAGDFVAWRQFELFAQAGKLVSDTRFLAPYLYFSLRSLLDRRDYTGGLIVVANVRQ